MDVVIDTTLVVKAGWLPELAHISTSVVIVKEVLGQERYQVESDCVRLTS